MAIKGIEKRFRYPTVGRFSLAWKRVTGGTEQVDYFIVPKELRTLLGEKPKEVRVRFPGSNLNALFDHDLLLWGAKSVKVRCDGETARVFPNEGPSFTDACQWTDREKGGCPKGCKAEGRLVFVVVDESAPQGRGPYEVRIGGMQKVADTMGLLTFYLGTLGERFTSAEFLLRREPRQSTYLDPKDNRKKTRATHPVKIVFDRLSVLQGIAPPVPPAALNPAPVETEEPEEHHDEDEEGTAPEAEDAEFTPAPEPETAAPLQPERDAAAPARPTPPGVPDATLEEVEAAVGRAGIGVATFWNWVQAKYPKLTEAGKPQVYGVLVAQLDQAVKLGAVAKLKGDMFVTLKAAARGGR